MITEPARTLLGILVIGAGAVFGTWLGARNGDNEDAQIGLLAGCVLGAVVAAAFWWAAP